MIAAEGLKFRYRGNSSYTLHGLDFKIAPGEIFGFLGPSGAGKSTTQKILMGILKSYEGTVTVNGREIKAVKRTYYETIGVAFEFPNFYEKLTALENLSFFAAMYGTAPKNPMPLLERLSLGEDARKPLSAYSKGMRVRLNLVRALQHDPGILFLDEPTAGLDPATARTVKDLIKEQKDAGKTVFLTTHDMSTADELCDRVAFMTEGRLRTVDRPGDLKLRMGSRTLEVEVAGGETPARAVFPLDGLGNDAEFLSLIRTAEIRTMHSREASLEDVFIAVTGERLS